jgi:Tfp pilus assembly protein PilF
VVTVAFLLLAAAIVGPDARGRGDGEPSRRLPMRIATATVVSIVAIGSLVAIVIPMAGTASVRESQRAAERGAIADALDKARAAQRIQPYAATAKLQEALVLELDGNLGAAAAAARVATRHEPTNWHTWLVRSRLEARQGRAHDAAAAYHEARSLNPHSTLFSR